MTHPSDIVITGSGVVSPIGIGNKAFWAALEQGTSGVRKLESFDSSAFPAPFGGELADFDPKQYVTPRKSLKVMCREIQTGFAAARLAIDDAKLDPVRVDPDRFGVVFGSEMYYCDLAELSECYRPCVRDGQFDMSQWGTAGISKLFPLWMLMYLPNMVACHVGIAHDARGHNNTVACGDASSLLALIEAVHVLRRGITDIMVVGGAGSRINVTPLAFRGEHLLSHRASEPAAACRPFDADRDGLVNGEGAGALVVETRAHAAARGATIQAEILGSGQSFELAQASDFAQGAGLQRAIRGALSASRLAPSDIGHVNAHGLSTIADDRREAAAIRATLGDVPVTAPKSYFGNLGAGGGVVELIASLLALREGRVPMTLNYETPDPTCEVNVVRRRPLEGTRPTALVLNYSTTGQTAAVLLGSPHTSSKSFNP
jgi:3-oxoacyl-[acyl-carrier-protein] synthase II